MERLNEQELREAYEELGRKYVALQDESFENTAKIRLLSVRVAQLSRERVFLVELINSSFIRLSQFLDPYKRVISEEFHTVEMLREIRGKLHNGLRKLDSKVFNQASRHAQLGGRTYCEHPELLKVNEAGDQVCQVCGDAILVPEEAERVKPNSKLVPELVDNFKSYLGSYLNGQLNSTIPDQSGSARARDQPPIMVMGDQHFGWTDPYYCGKCGYPTNSQEHNRNCG